MQDFIYKSAYNDFNFPIKCPKFLGITEFPSHGQNPPPLAIRVKVE